MKRISNLQYTYVCFGNSDKIREGQTSMLFNDMKTERKKGNYVICGGDFNHNLS